MAEIRAMAEHYMEQGYSERDANARGCQDIVLKAISLSSLSRNITVKGGVVMRSITGDIRRATQDLDLDFIRYSLSDDAIRAFIGKLNGLEGIKIEINGDIEELSQQEYNGKRVYITISDDTGHSLESKIDLGAHKNMNIEQEEYCFDVCMDDEGASLLMNTGEQIFAEKLRSLLKFGPLSTRYKDVFDLCYWSENTDRTKLLTCIDTYIYDDPDYREQNMEDILERMSQTFSNQRYRSAIVNSRKKPDWLGVGVDAAFKKILDYLESLK